MGNTKQHTILDTICIYTQQFQKFNSKYIEIRKHQNCAPDISGIYISLLHDTNVPHLPMCLVNNPVALHL